MAGKGPKNTKRQAKPSTGKAKKAPGKAPSVPPAAPKKPVGKSVSSSKKASGSKKSATVIPTRTTETPVEGTIKGKGSIAHQYPTTKTLTDSKGKTSKVKANTPMAGGATVVFRLRNKSYQSNEKQAVRILRHYKKHLMTWQVAKPWYAKGTVKNTVLGGKVVKDRKKSQGSMGRGKVLGYSTGKGPQQISSVWVNRAVRETHQSVKAALSGAQGHYHGVFTIHYKPAPFGQKGSPAEFDLIIFLPAKGLRYYKAQQKLSTK